MLASQETLAAVGEDLGRWLALGSERLRGRQAPVMIFAPVARA
jgi:class 3 adenylate cyclase